MSAKELVKKLKLEEDGKNLPGFLFKLESLVNAQGLEDSFKYTYDPSLHSSVPSGQSTVKRVSVLVSEEYRKPFLDLDNEKQLLAIGDRRRGTRGCVSLFIYL